MDCITHAKLTKTPLDKVFYCRKKTLCSLVICQVMKSFMVHATVAGVVLLEEPQSVVVKNVVAVHELKAQ